MEMTPEQIKNNHFRYYYDQLPELRRIVLAAQEAVDAAGPRRWNSECPRSEAERLLRHEQYRLAEVEDLVYHWSPRGQVAHEQHMYRERGWPSPDADVIPRKIM